MRISTLRNLLTAVVCLFGVLTAQAQFTATFEAYPASAWGNEKPVNFSLTEVATTLSTDAATLVAALDAWEMGTDDMFFLTTPDGESAEYTQGGKGGFWVNADGVPQAWSDDNTALRWFNTIGWDAENDVFTITIGQYPDQCTAGDIFRPHFTLKYGEKAATFDVTISIIETPSYDLPEPTLLWKQLNIVDELVIDVEQKPFSNWSSSKVEVNLTEAAAKLGITDLNMINVKLKDMLYATEYYLTDDVALGGMKSDTLTNQASANGIGFWLHSVNDADGNATFECSRAVYDSSDQFYVEAFEFDAETGILSCNLGQTPNLLNGGEQWYTYLYLVLGDKAVCLRYNLNILVVERGGINDYTKVGEAEFVVEQEPTTAYEAKIVRPDMEAIAAALGCEIGDIELAALKDDIEFGGNTANNGGFWFNSEGYVISYGSSCSMYVEPQTEGDYSTLRVGQYPNYFSIGQEQTVKLYFLGNQNVYVANITLKVVAPAVIDGEFESVAQRTYSFQQVPTGYVWTPGVDIPYSFIEENIGTSDWVVYGLALLDENGNELEGNAKYTNKYTITETPGFWLDKDGRNSGWNSNAIFGITAGGAAGKSGQFSLMQYPDRCNIGEVYKTKLFFVNEATSKMVTFNFIFNIVESVVEPENVGYEDIVIPVAEDDQVTDIDLTKAAEALGVTVDYLLNPDNACLRGMTEGGIFGGGQNCTDGLGFNADGYYDMAYGLVYFTIEESKIWSYSIEPVNDDFSLTTQFCFQIDNKQYVYNVKFVSAAAYNGIQDIATEQKHADKVFDLSGRQVLQPTRGLYIMNGKKVVVK